MRVTHIKQQAKRTDRYSVYIDGLYSFPLSEAELLNAGLRVGQEFTPTELEELKNRAVIDKAYDRALNLIMQRPRSEWELRDYLKRHDYDEACIGSVLAQLKARGYVDDLDFGRRWVENRRLLKATSKRRLAQELKQKRVSEDIIQEILADDETDEREILRELIARKRKQTKYQDNLKLMQYLSRQGYNYDDIKSILNE